MECRCLGVTKPIRIPERRAAGWVWDRPPLTCARSSHRVPSLELAKTPRCLPWRVEVAACWPGPPLSMYSLLAPAPPGSVWLGGH